MRHLTRAKRRAFPAGRIWGFAAGRPRARRRGKSSRRAGRRLAHAPGRDKCLPRRTMARARR